MGCAQATGLSLDPKASWGKERWKGGWGGDWVGGAPIQQL